MTKIFDKTITLDLPRSQYYEINAQLYDYYIQLLERQIHLYNAENRGQLFYHSSFYITEHSIQLTILLSHVNMTEFPDINLNFKPNEKLNSKDSLLNCGTFSYDNSSDWSYL